MKETTMRVSNFILILIVSLSFNGCYMGEATYEVFESNRNFNMNKSWVPNMYKGAKKVYDNNKYIYIYESPEKCVYGYLTNRDDKPEKVIGWIIISGKEFCKEQQAYGF